MSKKLKEMGKKFIKAVLAQQKWLMSIQKKFYNEKGIEDYQCPVHNDDELLEMYESEKLFDEDEKYELPLDEDKEKDFETFAERKEKIFQIHQNVLEGKSGNAEILFDKGRAQFGKEKVELSNIVARICTYDIDQCFFFREGDLYNARVFINGREIYLVLGVGNDRGEAIFIPSDFFLLGGCKDKKSGIAVSSEWTEEQCCGEIVDKSIFCLVRDMVYATELEERWEQVKADAEKKKEEERRRDIII